MQTSKCENVIIFIKQTLIVTGGSWLTRSLNCLSVVCNRVKYVKQWKWWTWMQRRQNLLLLNLHWILFSWILVSWKILQVHIALLAELCLLTPEHQLTIQESPAIADKPARRESLPKLLQFDVPTALSLTILAYLYAFSCYCVPNPRNPEKFTENSNLWSLRSSKVIDLGANRKPICDLLLVTNSNFSRICYRFRDIHG